MPLLKSLTSKTLCVRLLSFTRAFTSLLADLYRSPPGRDAALRSSYLSFCLVTYLRYHPTELGFVPYVQPSVQLVLIFASYTHLRRPL
jgi:hypothetical protein